MYRKISKIAALLALTLPLAAAALSSDKEQPMELTADQAELDNATGVSVYTGNVVLTQGTLEITVHQNSDGELEKVLVDGRPATYQQLPDDEPLPVRARAPRMEYYSTAPKRVKLLRGATLTQGKNRFDGQTIVYFSQQDRVEAEGGKTDDGRIRIKFFPNQDKQEDKAQ